MKALQLHYTSCRAGRAESAGFQTRTMTPGIRPDEQREIERQGLYRPPRDAPPSPSAEELDLDEHFPRAFRSYRLTSGRKAITTSCYAGKDYTGRWGNFFAHTLVLDAHGTTPRHWPVDFAEWPGWKRRLEPQEDGDEPPDPLPAVSLNTIEPAESYRMEELQAFLHERPDRQEWLARMARALLAEPSEARPLVIRASPLDGAFWVAALVKLFPPWLVWDLSLSTYQDDPRGAAQINATVAGTEFSFDDSERRYRFYMFAPDEDLASPLPSIGEAGYPQLAVSWLVERPETLLDFFDFLERGFQDLALDAELLRGAAHLFAAGDAASSKAALDLGAALAFAAGHSTETGRIEALERLGDGVGQAPLPQNPEAALSILEFLTEGAARTRQPQHRVAALCFWERWLDRALDGGEEDLTTVERGRVLLRKTLEPWRPEMASRWLERSRRLQAPVEPRCLAWTLEDLAVLRRVPVWRQPEVRHCVEGVLHGGEPVDAAEAVLSVAEDGATLAGLAQICSELAPGGDVGRALARVLTDRTELAGARLELDRAEAWEVLFGEWQALCGQAEDPRRELERYRREVLAKATGYRDHYEGRIYEVLFAHLDPRARREQAAAWLVPQLFERLPQGLREQVVRSANDAVSFDGEQPDGDLLAERVETAAERESIVLQPDRPRLRRAVERAGRRVDGQELQEIEKALEGVDASSYRQFLEGFLCPALARANSHKAHELILASTYRREHGQPFRDAYRGFYRQRPPELPRVALQMAVKLHLMGPAAESIFLRDVLESTRSDLLDALAELSKEDLDKLDRPMGLLDGRYRKRWVELLEQAHERRTSLFHKGWRKVRRLMRRS